MANETLAQIPSDVADPIVLKRFLSSLVEKLDIVLGFRGNDAYASGTSVKDLATSTKESLSSLSDSLSTIDSTVKTTSDSIADHEERLISAEEQVRQLQAFASTDLRDFNAEGWPIYSFFTCLGSEVLNPPGALTAADTYSFFSSVLPSFVQTVTILDNTGYSRQFVRTGLTWSEVAANGWLSV